MKERINKKIFSFIKSYIFCFILSWKVAKSIFIFRILFELLIAIQPIISIFLIKYIIDSLVFILSNSDNGNINIIITLFISLLLIRVLISFINTMQETLSGIHSDMISNYIKIEIAEKASSLDLSYFDDPKFYNEILNIQRDSYSLETINIFVINTISSVFNLIGAFIILLYLHWIFPLIMIVSAVPTVVIKKRHTEYVFNWQRNRAPEERKMNYLLNLFVDRVYSKDIKLFSIKNYMLEKYKIYWEKWIKEKKSLVFKNGLWVSLFSFVPELGKVIIIFFVSINILKNNLTIGDFYLYNGITDQVIASIIAMVSSVVSIYDSDMKITKYREFLSWAPKTKATGTLSINKINGIKFDNVSFKYPGTENNVLSDVSFELSSNEKVALVGLNGAGKTTIINLLLRFYDPTKGRILINNVDIKEYDLNKLRKCFSVLFQDYANYAFSIEENIVLSDIQARSNSKKLIEASDKSGVSKIVDKYKTGYETYLSRRFECDGKELSGGEWQKIALARTFFRNGDFIILDEPSSSLDPEAEHEIFKQFAKLCENKGAIFISHRLSNVIMADKILVIEHGRIIEEGTHQDLIENSGRYAELFNIQAQKYLHVDNTKEEIISESDGYTVVRNSDGSFSFQMTVSTEN